jgi:ATP-dependent Clp protease ATP-binding subunit ClpA
VFVRFTDRSRRALILAQKESCLLEHSVIGSEHLLLGLIAEEEGIAAKVLESLGISLSVARSQVEEMVGPAAKGSKESPPFTTEAKNVLELSLREALQLHHSYIGTEHILLGLVRQDEGLAAKFLQSLGVDLPRVRQKVIQRLDYQDVGFEVTPTSSAPPPAKPQWDMAAETMAIEVTAPDAQEIRPFDATSYTVHADGGLDVVLPDGSVVSFAVEE